MAAKPDQFAMAIVSAVRKKVKGADVSLASQGEVLSEVKAWIPTGFPGLDHTFGGGWPMGRASEVSGPEASGKSALAQMAALQCQRKGGVVAYLDFENALDPVKIANLGIDMSRLIYHSPTHIEEGWDVVWAIMAQLKATPTEAPTLIIWDSVGGSVPKAELEGDSGDMAVGAVARLMNQGCRRMFRAIAEVNAHMMWVNQQRVKFGGFAKFGPPPKETSGGAGLRYAATLRVACQKVATLKDSANNATGYLVRTQTDKNRGAPPHQRSTWVLDFRYGPSPELTMFELLKDARRLVSAGPGLFSMTGVKHAPFKRADWYQVLADPDFRSVVESAYMDIVRAGGVKAVVTSDGDD